MEAQIYSHKFETELQANKTKNIKKTIDIN